MGMTMTYPASEAMLDMIPAKRTMGVRYLLLAFIRSFFRDVLNKPVHSATPTPSMATSTVPSGAKPVKFLVAELNM